MIWNTPLFVSLAVLLAAIIFLIVNPFQWGYLYLVCAVGLMGLLTIIWTVIAVMGVA